jgi:hypothetical protein
MTHWATLSRQQQNEAMSKSEGRRPLLAPTVVGRVDELRVLRAGLDAAAAGRGSTVVLLDEAGVGKSRLVREVRLLCAERGAVALVGQAVDAVTASTFRPLTEALLGLYRTGPIDRSPTPG